jgi:hypothetical protein
MGQAEAEAEELQVGAASTRAPPTPTPAEHTCGHTLPYGALLVPPLGAPCLALLAGALALAHCPGFSPCACCLCPGEGTLRWHPRTYQWFW